MLSLLTILVGFVLGIAAAAPRAPEDEARLRMAQRAGGGPFNL